MAVGLDLQNELDEPDGLHRLTEGLGRLVGHFGTDAAQLQQLRAAGLILLLFRQLPRQCAVAQGKGAHRVDHDQHGPIEYGLVDAVRVGQIQRRQTRPRALLIAAQALPQDARIVDRQMRVTGVELALHAKDAGFHEYTDFLGQQRLAAGAQVVVLPERRDVTQLLLRLLRDVEHVAVSFFEQIQLFQDEVHRILRENGRVAVFGGLIAGQQRLILDIDAHMLQNFFEHQRPRHHARLILIFLIGLCGQNGALGVHIRLFVQHLLAEGFHPGRQGSKVFRVFHKALSYAV